MNHLLEMLPPAELAVLEPHLIHQPLALRQVLHVRGSLITDLVFIEQGIASLTVKVEEHNSEIEVGLIGREGIVGGMVLLLPQFRPTYQAFMQVAGSGHRITVANLLTIIDQTPMLRQRCYDFFTRLMTQAVQLAGCNVRHTVVARMARWLLMTHQRIDSDELPITHEFLAVMLGASRPNVSLAASSLQNAGLIQQARGKIIILNYDGLEGAACNCYVVMKALYDTKQCIVENKRTLEPLADCS